MDPLLHISPRVAEQLGPEGRAQVEHADLTERLWCPLCQTHKPQGNREPMTLITATTGPDVLVIGFAHRACADRHGDDCPALLDSLSDPEGMDAQAFFGIRATPVNRAVMAFEPSATSLHLSESGDTVHPFIAWHLQEGFTLVRAGIEDLVPPLAPRWRLSARSGLLRLEHDTAGIDYQQDLDDDVRTWLRVVKREGRAVVLTGVGLDLGGDAQQLPAFTGARNAGLLVAATVLFG